MTWREWLVRFAIGLAIALIVVAAYGIVVLLGIGWHWLA